MISRPKLTSMTPSYSMPDLAAVALTAAVVAVWAEAAAGTFSFRALLACEAVFLSFYLVGSLFAGFRSIAAGVRFDLPLRLLVGYAAINTALFALAWISPLGIVANFGILLAIAAALFSAARPVRKQSDDGVGFVVLALALVAATLWCQDSIRPMSFQGDSVLVKPWLDGFYHAVHIRIFGASHGAATIQDFRMAGVPARLYHYGCYLTPALIKQASGVSSYTAFAGILAPVGVFFTGLAAYALVGSFWGAWPGLAASAALLLLPDGAHQGMRNTFMSYHWLTQISPSATYGLALLAVAWLFVIGGCLRGNRLQVAAGWLAGGAVVVYKAHFFIASAFLLLMVPPLFFRSSPERAPLGRGKRIAWAAVSLAVYLTAIVSIQKVPGVPPIRLDGSCVDRILELVNSFGQPGPLREFLTDHIGTGHSIVANLAYGIPFVLLGALGLFLPLLAVFVLRLRKRTPPLVWLFPLLLLGNFLVMFFGLALDFGRSTPDELSHRPVIIVYFMLVAWIGGAAGLGLLESRRLNRIARRLLLALTVLLLAVPGVLGAGVQRMWNMRGFSFAQIPTAIVRAAEFIRDHGGPNDIVQDARFDRFYALAALSERRSYASRTLTRMPYNNELLETRIDSVESLMQLRDVEAITATARSLGITWFMLSPGQPVSWPDEFMTKSAFELDGFRVFRF